MRIIFQVMIGVYRKFLFSVYPNKIPVLPVPARWKVTIGQERINDLIGKRIFFRKIPQVAGVSNSMI